MRSENNWGSSRKYEISKDFQITQKSSVQYVCCSTIVYMEGRINLEKLEKNQNVDKMYVLTYLVFKQRKVF